MLVFINPQSTFPLAGFSCQSILSWPSSFTNGKRRYFLPLIFQFLGEVRVTLP